MTLIFIDRRKAGKAKSAPNRQKLVKRIRQFIKTANPQSLGTAGVAQVYSAGRSTNNPVKIASNALEEPWFAYGKGGDLLTVIPGNTTYQRGDEIPFTDEEMMQQGGGPGDAGQDDFVINIASNEFLELFFEDCELPNLDDEKSVEKAENTMVHAGFATSGTPSQLSIIRTYKQALGRRRALSVPYRKEKEELEARMKEIYDILANDTTNDGFDADLSKELDQIELRLVELNRKIAACGGFDKVDLRFHKKDAKPLKQVDAVLVMLMDISGSMGKEEKTIARRWFALLYAFIKRRYENTELVFVAHTDEAFEMSEGDFFSTQLNGGTAVSLGLEKVNQIIKERYDANHTNIYVSHASDGDNWESDKDAVRKEMLDSGGLMHKLQYFSYVEVGNRPSWGSSGDTNLWEEYNVVHDKCENKMSMAVIETPDDCYTIFKKTFKKK